MQWFFSVYICVKFKKMGQMQNLGLKSKFFQSTIKWVSNFECDFQPEASGGHTSNLYEKE